MTLEQTLDILAAQKIMARMWAGDHTVWKPDPAEINNRLGWLTIAERMQADIPRMEEFTAGLQKDGYTQALLLGMGGSSLAPEVFRKTFGVKPGYLDVEVLDSTDPGAVLGFAKSLDPRKTVYIVSTKSGGTIETFSFMYYFYNHLLDGMSAEDAGQHFIAITDPHSKLEEVARQHQFREVFLHDPNIGGRYSALSYFGLLPAALLGVDLRKLLANAHSSMQACGAQVEASSNPAARLGAAISDLALSGRDKLTFVISPSMRSFGDWVEQLIAESTGKEGRGILPVVGEELLEADCYSADRAFVHIELEPEVFQSARLAQLEAAGYPVLRVKINERYDLGGQFFLWEMATAVAGWRLGINPFDQPNVESAKVLARELVAAFKQDGRLPESSAEPPSADKLKEFLAGCQAGISYVALQAYLKPCLEMDLALQTLRSFIQKQTRAATTVGYGPRFLHSTGQLHKGDGGSGLFIQFSDEPGEDALIPDEMGKPGGELTFGTLIKAQALGDARALSNNGRKVMRIDLGKDALGGIKKLDELSGRGA